MTVQPPRLELRLQRRVWRAAQAEGVQVHRVGNHGDLGAGHAARHDVGAQAFANGEHVVGTLDGAGLQAAGGAVTQAALVGGAVVHRGVLPERANFVHHRDAQLAPHLEGRQRIEHRRMGVDDVGLDLAGDFFQAPAQCLHQGDFAAHRQVSQQPGAARRAVKMQAIDVFFSGLGRALLGRGDVKRLPAQRALLAQQRRRAKGVAAVQRNGVVENVQDAQGHDAVATGASTTWRKKASNISSVQRGAL